MKRLLLAVLALSLSACTQVTYSTEQVQVAPNTVACTGIPSKQCLLVRPFKAGQPGPEWRIAEPDAIKNFDYQLGYMYDLTLQSECRHGGFPGVVADSVPTYSLMQVNSKTASVEVIAPPNSWFWPGFC